MGSLKRMIRTSEAEIACREQINEIIADTLVTNFKIGMSADDPAVRKAAYMSDRQYNAWDILYVDEEKSVIVKLEKLLIEFYMNHAKCDNDQVGGGKMTGEHKPYIYVAGKLKNRLSTR